MGSVTLGPEEEGFVVGSTEECPPMELRRTIRGLPSDVTCWCGSPLEDEDLPPTCCELPRIEPRRVGVLENFGCATRSFTSLQGTAKPRADKRLCMAEEQVGTYRFWFVSPLPPPPFPDSSEESLSEAVMYEMEWQLAEPKRSADLFRARRYREECVWLEPGWIMMIY